jgi:hypothetical protein
LTIAKLLLSEDPSAKAKEAEMAADKVAPAVVTGSVASADGVGEGRGKVGSRDGSHAVISDGTTSGWAGDSFRRYSEYRLRSKLWR